MIQHQRSPAIGEDLYTLEPLFEALPTRKDKPALLVLGKKAIQRWSYAELGETVERLAQGLASRGIAKGDFVALLADNQPAWMAACLAILRAGAVAVPMDVQSGDELLRHILKDSRPRWIFTTTAKAEHLEKLAMDFAPEPILLDGNEQHQRHWRHWLKDHQGKLPTPKPDDPATLFYTSGTTGPPKGVPLTHGNLAFQLTTLLKADLVTDNDRVLLPLPLHHVYPLVVGMLAPLTLGLPLILPYSLTGPQIVRALREGRVTFVIGVPRLYRALFSGIQSRAEAGGHGAALFFKTSLGLSGWLRRRLGLRLGKVLLYPLHRQIGPDLRVLACGGAALDPELGQRLEDLGWGVAIGYGLTETSPLLTINHPGKARLDSVGKPIDGVDIHIDPTPLPRAEAQDQKTDDTRGEILVRGPNVFTGYRHLPERTAEAFTEDGWFRTGDIGYLDRKGYLHVTGRVSTVIVTESGKNIQPDEVETVYEENSLIREIGILQDDNRLVAVVVPALSEIRQQGKDDIDQAIQQAMERCSRQLPSYQRIGDYVMVRDPLPRTRLGKIRRHKLLERYRQAKAGKTEPSSRGALPIEDMSDQDRALLENPTAKQVWDWLAGRYSERRLTPDTSPQLDLGVDSLEWLNLTLEIRNRSGVELKEEAINRIDTVRDLLQEVGEAERIETASPTLPLEQPEEVLSDRQKRWLRPLGPLSSVLTWLLFHLNRLMMHGLFRLRVQGDEQLPDQGPFILTPNHASLLDPFAVAAALDQRQLRETYWGGWTGIAFANPFNRWISRLARAVPIDPGRAAISSLAFGAAVLKQHKNLVWFPEGERSLRGQLQPFKPGIGLLLQHFQTPVIPVYIQGSFEALPRGKRWPRLQPITVRFGAPLPPAELEQQGQGEQPQHRIVQALHNQVERLGEQTASSVGKNRKI